ncbi:lysM and putative peptidoglycan-binding domain-containing protein 3 [Nasonia vitripennis]|uniref:LysM domain-containing protein n=1 Tax=Nasonia vitripennis TaxID=7425 RepID=A0A7M7QWP1_NASVI|nr:lysM and putative peptidoglycan-binding domain-containing protein 3 [Nasonia vitripennis]XP_032454858.1 lysM and putative peptidoglycan-binding domain-containing protein 3 [Nasonia vitripennis]
MRKKSASGTNEFQKAGRQAAYQRGNQREGSPHYVFLYSEDDQSEDEEVFPMKDRNSKPALPRKVEVINVKIQSDDTLQALALRYHCTISELKRINNIHKDNEIHAHRSIKVPVQAYSLLTETLGKSNESNQDSALDPAVSNQTEGTSSKENQLIDLLTTASTSSTIEINNIILNSTVEPLSQYNNESSQSGIDETETDQLINSIESINRRSSNDVVNTFKCSGADWGLSWFQLLCFSLLLGFLGPIIYVLYIAESSKHHHSS